jgi:hypothetical protein
MFLAPRVSSSKPAILQACVSSPASASTRFARLLASRSRLFAAQQVECHSPARFVSRQLAVSATALAAWDALQSGAPPAPDLPGAAPLSRNTRWHSGAHLLGWALQASFDPCLLSDGPALASPAEDAPVPPGTGGFYYDAVLPRPVTEEDLRAMEKCASPAPARG